MGCCVTIITAWSGIPGPCAVFGGGTSCCAGIMWGTGPGIGIGMGMGMGMGIGTCIIPPPVACGTMDGTRGPCAGFSCMSGCGPAADAALAAARACCCRRPLWCPRDPRIMSLVRWIMHTVGRSPGMPKCGRRRHPGAWQVCHESTRWTHDMSQNLLYSETRIHLQNVKRPAQKRI